METRRKIGKIIFRKRNSSTEISVTNSKENLENLQIKTSDSSSKRVISLTNALKNFSENGSQKSLNIESQPEGKENGSNYDELRADLNHLHLNLFIRKMSQESFRMNLRPKLIIHPPRDYVFKKNLVSFEDFFRRWQH